MQSRTFGTYSLDYITYLLDHKTLRNGNLRHFFGLEAIGFVAVFAAQVNVKLVVMSIAYAVFLEARAVINLIQHSVFLKHPESAENRGLVEKWQGGFHIIH